MGRGNRPAKAKNLVLVPGDTDQVLGTAVTAPGPAPMLPPDAATADDRQTAAIVEPSSPAQETPPSEESSAVGGVELDADQSEEERQPAYPTHLDAGPVSDPKSPEEALTALNHLALQGVVDESQFQELYLHHFGPLGATPGAAHRQWEALKAKQEAERLAAQQMAERMQAAIADVRPWNPHEDPAKAKAEVQRMVTAFNAAVDEAQQQAAKRGREVASHLKDRIAGDLGKRSGLGYNRADEFVAAWAGTSNDHSEPSIALQVAAAEKFGLEPTGYLAKVGAEFNAKPGFAKTKEEARRFVDAMYEHTQEWLKARGIKEVALFRGMHDSIGADTAPVDAAPGPIPAKEQEFVVAGGSGQQVMAAANQKVSYSHAGGSHWKA
jgi:hypothetical protein